VLVLQGDKDDRTPLEETQLFVNGMIEAGNECRLVAYPGKGHGFANYRDGSNPCFLETMREVDRFLVEHEYLAGEPTIDSFTYSGKSWSPAAVGGSPA
jgi:acetyl esterase/lipase